MQVSYWSRARSSLVPLVRGIPRLWLVLLLALASWALVAALVWGVSGTWQALVSRLL